MKVQDSVYNQSLSDLVPSDGDRKKLEFLADKTPYRSGIENTLHDAIDALFIEAALEESVNSDEPWCVLAILSSIDGVMIGGPFASDAALYDRRASFVKKVSRMVEPLCEPRNPDLLDWLARITYLPNYTPESIAAWWNRISPEQKCDLCPGTDPALSEDIHDLFGLYRTEGASPLKENISVPAGKDLVLSLS